MRRVDLSTGGVSTLAAWPAFAPSAVAWLACPCPAGAAFLTPADTVCLSCAPGTAAAAAANVCASCTQGTYASATAAAACTSCGPGRFLPTRGGSAAANCSECAAGAYQPAAAASACVLCAVGSYQTGAAAGNCIACAAGKYSTGNGSASVADCTPCPAGKYVFPAAVAAANASTGPAAACVACPAHSSSTAGAAASAADCTCNAGFAAVAGGGACGDVDECAGGGCGGRACVNTMGSFVCTAPAGMPLCGAVSPTSAQLDGGALVWVNLGLSGGAVYGSSNVTALRFGAAAMVAVSTDTGGGWVGAAAPAAVAAGAVDGYALRPGGAVVCTFAFEYLPRPAPISPPVLSPAGGAVTIGLADYAALAAGRSCSVLFAGQPAAASNVDVAAGRANATAPAAASGAAAAAALRCAAGGGRAAGDVDLGAYVEYRAPPRATVAVAGPVSIVSASSTAVSGGSKSGCVAGLPCAVTVVVDDPPYAPGLRGSDLSVAVEAASRRQVGGGSMAMIGASVTVIESSSRRLVVAFSLPPAALATAGQLALSLVPSAAAVVNGIAWTPMPVSVAVLPPNPSITRIWPTSAPPAGGARVQVWLSGLLPPPPAIAGAYVAAFGAVGPVAAVSVLPGVDGDGGVAVEFVSPPAAAAAGLTEIKVTVSHNSTGNATAVVAAAGASSVRLSAPFLIAPLASAAVCVAGCTAAAVSGTVQRVQLTARTAGPALGSASGGTLALDCVLAAVPAAHNAYCAAVAAASIDTAAACDSAGAVSASGTILIYTC